MLMIHHVFFDLDLINQKSNYFLRVTFFGTRYFFEQDKMRFTNTKKQSPQYKTYRGRLQRFTKSQRRSTINKSYKTQTKQETRPPAMVV
jgi:hypothetical protein